MIDELQKLKRELKRKEDANEKIYVQKDKLMKKIVSTYELQRKITELSHRFEKNEWVVLDTREVVKIERCFGSRMYEVIVPVIFFRGKTYTKQEVHEKQILCHVAGLSLKDCKEFQYNPTKWSQRPSEEVK